jgi:nitrate reductase NapE component
MTWGPFRKVEGALEQRVRNLEARQRRLTVWLVVVLVAYAVLSVALALAMAGQS